MESFIPQDPMVSAVFGALRQCSGATDEKLKAVIRAGKIAEAFSCGGAARNIVGSVFEDTATSHAPLPR